jgi:endoglucanase
MDRKASNRRKALRTLATALLSVAPLASSFAANDVLDPTKRLYVNWFGSAVGHAAALQGQERANALQIASFPVATWLTAGTPAEVRQRARGVVADAGAENAVPVLVAYYLPFRDCQQYSAGGAANTAEYKAWIDGLAAGVGDRKAVVLLEPDGLGIIPHYTSINGATEWCQPAELDPATAANERFEQLNYAVDVLTALPNTAVYLDGTHSAWLGAGDIAHRLVRAGVQRADGFFLNVSNYERTERLEKYGAWVAKCIHYGTNPAEGGWRLGHFDWCASQYFPANPNDFSTWVLTDQWYADNVDNASNPPTSDTLAHFVIDTSRNGAGPWTPPAGKYSDPEVWCNPPLRGLGERPTTVTNAALIDAKLWVKVPGESDGRCLRGTAGPQDPERGMVDPAAGQWFKEQAAELLALAQPALTAPTCRVNYQVHADWPHGFLTQVTVRNMGSQPIRGWSLRWAFSDEETLKHVWGVRASQKRSVVTARNLDWNRVIAPGRSHTFGFVGEQHDDEHDPSLLFFLNGAWCAAD